jgi:hypothetical protein
LGLFAIGASNIARLRPLLRLPLQEAVAQLEAARRVIETMHDRFRAVVASLTHHRIVFDAPRASFASTAD